MLLVNQPYSLHCYCTAWPQPVLLLFSLALQSVLIVFNLSCCCCCAVCVLEPVFYRDCVVAPVLLLCSLCCCRAACVVAVLPAWPNLCCCCAACTIAIHRCTLLFIVVGMSLIHHVKQTFKVGYILLPRPNNLSTVISEPAVPVPGCCRCCCCQLPVYITAVNDNYPIQWGERTAPAD